MSKLKDKVAIVTGASKGIGAGIARQLAQEGAKVVVNYATSKDAADKVVCEIKISGGEAVAVKADVSRKSEIEFLFAESKKAFGKLDILVNNAGTYEFLPIEQITEDHFHKHYNLNVLGLLLCTQEALKYFDESGGSVVNISSVASTYGPANGSVYAGTKAAVDIITKSLAKELAKHKVRVNAVNPGMVMTEGFIATGFADSEFRKSIESQTPLRRIGCSDDIAPAVVFFSSSDSDWITGETLVISGGLR